MKSTTATEQLRGIVQRYTDGEILLPQFQRNYVWTPRKIRDLLDSLLRDLPIGGFYVWQPIGKRTDPKRKAFGSLKIQGPSAVYLIDGQQRLTSLEAAFGFYSGEDKGGAELECYLDLSAKEKEDEGARDTRLFVSRAGKKAIAERLRKGDPTLIEVKRFFDDKIDHDARNDKEKRSPSEKPPALFTCANIRAAANRLVLLDTAKALRQDRRRSRRPCAEGTGNQNSNFGWDECGGRVSLRNG